LQLFYVRISKFESILAGFILRKVRSCLIPLSKKNQNRYADDDENRAVAQRGGERLEERDVQVGSIQQVGEDRSNDAKRNDVAEDAADGIDDRVLDGKDAFRNASAVYRKQADAEGHDRIADRPVKPHAPTADEVGQNIANAAADQCGKRPE